MSTNITPDDFHGALKQIDFAKIPYPRYCTFRGIKIRVISNRLGPEFLNYEGKWQTIDLSKMMKPCPFCGSTSIDPEEVMAQHKDGTRYSYPGCANCGASCPQWNDRA